MIMNRTKPFMVPVEPVNPAIIKNEALCTECGHCFDVCENEIGVGAKYQFLPGENYLCIGCGQCTAACPEKSLTGRPAYRKVKECIADPDKIVIFSTSPSVRVGFADGFGKEPGTFAQGQMIGALRTLGADYVLDVCFGADLTIMEEGSELLKRVLTGSKQMPQFTSCCPAWVKYMEQYHPDKIELLSSAKSPIGMQGAIIKTYFAHKKKLDPEKIVSVAVTPCTAKKAEIAREEFCDAGKLLGIEGMRDNDYVITTQELVQWCKEEEMDIDTIGSSVYDSILGDSSGAGLIFGNTGGVMEAALRTAYKVVEKKDPPENFFELKPVRGLSNRKEAEVCIGNAHLKVCVLFGTAEADRFLQGDMSGYHFVEVMTCPGGCISGAGQPDCGVTPVPDIVRRKRISSLYDADKHALTRISMDNPEIADIYADFLKEPLSPLSEKLLHTHYKKG